MTASHKIGATAGEAAEKTKEFVTHGIDGAKNLASVAV